MLKLYDKTFSTLYGTLSTVTEALVEEERNGLFELSFVMLNTDSLFSYIEKENIIVCNANDTLLNQKFRIYNTRKLMNNKVAVFARHISFDLMYDYIESLSFENQSCEYALNQLFRLSNFSQHYKGYSDIVNAQNYSISNANLLSAIGGTEGSILDTFGTGAEILRDNENIHVLNKRGHDNSVTIEYRKNLTGFELEEDTTDLVTRILPYARYTPEGEEETIIKASYVDSPLINNYSHPFIKSIDYTDKFENDEVPTIEKLVQFANNEYTVNKVDIPKQNYKIEFIPLSKCVGYEAINDNISLCDTVTIIDTRYNINTQSKVIKTTFNVLKNRYESIELGEPRTSLGDIISSGSNDKVTEEQVKDIVSSIPSTNYPNTLPKVPALESFLYGFANIELRWTFENKVYYAYEVYASKTKDFTPNTFDLIYQGQASSYMFQAQPNEIWYFKVCGINSHNRRTQFSNEVEVVTTKIDDLSNYVSNMAIGDALIGELNLGRGWVGQLNANLLDVKGNFSVTDGNGKRTFDIDSFGNVNLTGRFKCFSDSNNYLFTEGAMTRGYLLGSQNPTFSSGIWKPDGINEMGYVSVGWTNSDHVDENGCLWLSPMAGGGGQLIFSRLISDGIGSHSGITYFKEGNVHYYSSLPNRQDAGVISHRFDGGLSAYTGFFNDIYVDGSLRVNSTVYTDQQSLFLVAGGYENQYYLQLLNNGYLIPGDSIQLGQATNPFYQLVCTYAPSIVSDARKKTDIKYIDNPMMLLPVNEYENITSEDMYNFIKDDLRLATYKLIDSKPEDEDKVEIGFLIQDIKDTKIGKYISNTKDENNYTYDMANRISVIEGALQKAIEKIENLEKEIQLLKEGV